MAIYTAKAWLKSQMIKTAVNASEFFNFYFNLGLFFYSQFLNSLIFFRHIINILTSYQF